MVTLDGCLWNILPLRVVASMLRMRELVDETPYTEYTPTTVLYELLAPNNDQPENPSFMLYDNKPDVRF